MAKKAKKQTRTKTTKKSKKAVETSEKALECVRSLVELHKWQAVLLGRLQKEL